MSDEQIRTLERRWRQSGAAIDEAALLAARAREGDRDVAALIRLLDHADPAVRRMALEPLADLTVAEADWDVLYAIARGLEQEAEAEAAAIHAVLVRLGERGINAKAPAQWAIQSLRYGQEPERRRAVALLRAVLAGVDGPAGGWSRVDLSPYASTLVDTLIARDPAPEAQVAADLLLLVARSDADAVARSLFIRWADGKGPAFHRLIESLEALDPATVEAATRRQPELEPTSADALLAQAGPGSGPWLVTRGQFSPTSTPAERIGLFAAGALVADVWITPQALAEAVTALEARGPVRHGRWDVMYATAWACAWTDDGGPLEVWSREGAVLRQEGDRLIAEDGSATAVNDVARVHAWVSADWIQRGVRLELTDGARLPIAVASEPTVAIDPTYDGIDLSADAAWARSLARAIGRALEVEVALDDPL